jgi:hypothetical protein
MRSIGTTYLFEINIIRNEHKLNLKYEYNHFIVEGRVLYLLNSKGHLIDRNMFKIKPKDIEEVHWSNFDSTLQGKLQKYHPVIPRSSSRSDGKDYTERKGFGQKIFARR